MDRCLTPWERMFKRIYTPFERFLRAQTTSGIILIIATIIAMILANSPLSEVYSHFFHQYAGLFLGEHMLKMSVHHWINDGLMAIFFFLIGLEIKREVLVGELSNIKAALLPIIAAIGGMVVPALIYMAFNYGSDGAHGWGIPMATDIAFAIAALMILGKHVPKSLVTFLVALAIVDDLGAILVIAIFYTDQLHLINLFYAFGVFGVMVLLNLFGVRKIIPYALLAVVMWYFMLLSGVHATIAGVVAALAIPMRPKKNIEGFRGNIKLLLDDFECKQTDALHINEDQKSLLFKVEEHIDDALSPSTRLEHALNLPVALLILPLFALANAGISLELGGVAYAMTQPVTLGVIFGLVVGKGLGIFGISWLAVKLGFVRLPSGTTLSQLFGVSMLGGIGFTMSMFIAQLSFPGNEQLLYDAKVGIIFASVVAAVFGYVWLRFVAKKT